MVFSRERPCGVFYVIQFSQMSETEMEMREGVLECGRLDLVVLSLLTGALQRTASSIPAIWRVWYFSFVRVRGYYSAPFVVSYIVESYCVNSAINKL